MAYDPSRSFITADEQLIVKGRDVFEYSKLGRPAKKLDDDDPRAKAARQERDAECVRMSYGAQAPTPPNR